MLIKQVISHESLQLPPNTAYLSLSVILGLDRDPRCPSNYSNRSSNLNQEDRKGLAILVVMSTHTNEGSLLDIKKDTNVYSV